MVQTAAHLSSSNSWEHSFCGVPRAPLLKSERDSIIATVPHENATCSAVTFTSYTQPAMCVNTFDKRWSAIPCRTGHVKLSLDL